MKRAPLAATAALMLAGGCVARPTHAFRELVAMSWNIQAGGKGIDSIAKVIQLLQPDVVGLQEVDVNWSDRSQFVDQAQALATRLGMHVRFAPIYSNPSLEPGKPPRQFGVALLSRYEITDWRNDTLTRLSTQIPNATPARMPGLLRGTIAVGYGTHLRVFVTHLDYRADPAVRRRQALETIAYLRDADIPTLLMGDLNATPNAPELTELFQAFSASWRPQSAEPPTYPAENPTKRIDYVLASNHFRVLSDSVPTVTVSDHRPVVARLLLRTR